MKRKLIRNMKKIWASTCASYYRWCNVFSCKKLKMQGPVNVSLTSYGIRLDKVYLTIESLFNQTVKPNAVFLWIAKRDCPSIESLPVELKRLVARGLHIELVDEDLRSYKKLVHLYEKYVREGFSLPIVTVDDDRIYPRNFLAEMLKSHQEHPQCTICYRGHLVYCDRDGVFDYNSSLKRPVPHSAHQELIPTGVGGVLYPLQSLSKEIADRDSFLKNAPDADDIWFKAVTLKNGFHSIMVHNEKKDFVKISYAYSHGLHHTNVRENKNNLCLEKTMRHFGLVEKFIKSE